VLAERKSLARSALELVLTVAAALVLALLVEAFVVKPYRIPSGSMEPTLKIDQRILVNRLGADFGSPKIGDIVVFHPPADYATCADARQGAAAEGAPAAQACDLAQHAESSVTFVKRVVGLPGDRLRIVNGHVIRNGQREPDGYTIPCGSSSVCNFRGTIVVPRNDFYMMGDNRPDSDDSRFWGPVPKAWIIGQAFFTYWPPDRVGFL
jgi:signal peptidase I